MNNLPFYDNLYPTFYRNSNFANIEHSQNMNNMAISRKKAKICEQVLKFPKPRRVFNFNFFHLPPQCARIP